MSTLKRPTVLGPTVISKPLSPSPPPTVEPTETCSNISPYDISLSFFLSIYLCIYLSIYLPTYLISEINSQFFQNASRTGMALNPHLRQRHIKESLLEYFWERLSFPRWKAKTIFCHLGCPQFPMRIWHLELLQPLCDYEEKAMIPVMSLVP